MLLCVRFCCSQKRQAKKKEILYTRGEPVLRSRERERERENAIVAILCLVKENYIRKKNREERLWRERESTSGFSENAIKLAAVLAQHIVSLFLSLPAKSLERAKRCLFAPSFSLSLAAVLLNKNAPPSLPLPEAVECKKKALI